MRHELFVSIHPHLHPTSYPLLICFLSRDIMIAMGQIQRPTLGHEASGIVRRVGDKVTRLTPGDRVIYMGVGAMRTHIRSHESCVHTLPENLH